MSVNVLSGLMPNKQFLSYIMVKTDDDDYVRFVLDKHA
jgi:hypothetical protein